MDNGYIMERKSHRVLVIPLLRTLNVAVCCVLPAACCVLFEYLSWRKFKFPLQLQPTALTGLLLIFLALTALGFFTESSTTNDDDNKRKK